MERISVDVPEQLPIGSIVIDSNGTAWQAKSVPPLIRIPTWLAADASSNALYWPRLLVDHGPLDVVHRGEAFVKQLGSRYGPSKGGDMATFPADLRVRKFPTEVPA